MARFTVISPVYNTSEYLDEFITSVTEQSFTDFELILVDDGSTDNSLDICKSYAEKDPRITVLTQKNQGAGAARNLGIEKASGELIMFFDSDDFADKKALETADKVMREKPVDLLIYGSEKIIYTKDGKELKRLPNSPKKLDLTGAENCRKVFCELIFASQLNQPWNKVYHKSIIDRHTVRFADTRRAQDAFFNAEYFKHINTLYTIPDALYFFRENDQSKVWKKYPRDSYITDIKYNSFLEKTLKEFGMYDGESRELADAWFYNTVFRDAGYYRNPHWNLSSKEQIEYVSTVIGAEYNQERAKTAWTKDKKTERIQKRILANDPKGLMRDIKLFSAKENAYDFYSRTLRKKLKR